MSERCPMYLAKQDFEYRGERVWVRVSKGDQRPWFDYMVMRFPEIFERLD